MSYVYIQSESRLYTVGFYKPDGKFEPESDHERADAAARRVHYLNGGQLISLDEAKNIAGTHLPATTNAPTLYTTAQVIALGPTMAYSGLAVNTNAPRETHFMMFRATTDGTHPKHIRFWRTARDEWMCDLIDTLRPVKNSDEKHYTHPRYLRTFVENNLSWEEYRTLRWTADERG